VREPEIGRRSRVLRSKPRARLAISGYDIRYLQKNMELLKYKI